jgi:CheY-like chemotaxis protein
MNAKVQEILIVDDQPEVSRLLEIVLRGEGRQLLFANSGEDALALVRNRRPALVLLDIMMPGTMDGYEVTRRLKNDPATASLHIIVMTAKVCEQDRQEAFAAGADDYISKPFDVIDLKTRVDRIIG